MIMQCKEMVQLSGQTLESFKVVISLLNNGLGTNSLGLHTGANSLPHKNS
jgi:hypothetical protein